MDRKAHYMRSDRRAAKWINGIAMMGVLASCIAACGAGDGVASVSVTSDVPIAGVVTLRATAVRGGMPAAALDYPVPGAPVTLSSSTPQLLGIRFDKDHTGDITVTVDALDAAGKVLGTGKGMGRVEPSKTTPISVKLTPSASPPVCVFDSNNFDDGCVFGQ